MLSIESSENRVQQTCLTDKHAKLSALTLIVFRYSCMDNFSYAVGND